MKDLDDRIIYDTKNAFKEFCEKIRNLKDKMVILLDDVEVVRMTAIFNSVLVYIYI